MLEKLKAFWRYVRRLTGDDAYEQYLKHFADNHTNQEGLAEEALIPLSREAFFKEWQDKKWKGIKRCC
ncbi:YbdD/YjiX family protein [Methylotenera sp.]|uniref:YbdD/YjiX family protein n=1 Tax=Methylotenera sp. TaxID=2051956 RepID=UPI00248733B9|nr:YbdD/YjiX family protein [Methylotenera sp.]MDI1362940.1 YbdD/YjiX family protein [Methylotenera sp.]